MDQSKEREPTRFGNSSEYYFRFQNWGLHARVIFFSSLLGVSANELQDQEFIKFNFV